MGLVSKSFMLASWQTVTTGLSGGKQFISSYPLPITHDQGINMNRGAGVSHLIVKLVFKTQAQVADADQEYTVYKQVPIRWVDTEGSARVGPEYVHEGNSYIF